MLNSGLVSRRLLPSLAGGKPSPACVTYTEGHLHGWAGCTGRGKRIGAGMANIGFLHSLLRRDGKWWIFAQSLMRVNNQASQCENPRYKIDIS